VVEKENLQEDIHALERDFQLRDIRLVAGPRPLTSTLLKDVRSKI
jgi:hypothetical protein